MDNYLPLIILKTSCFLIIVQRINSEEPLNGYSGQQYSLEEDNLVHMTRLSHSQSSLVGENTSDKKSKKKKENEEPVSGKLPCQPHWRTHQSKHCKTVGN